MCIVCVCVIFPPKKASLNALNHALTIFIELDYGKIYRKALYLMVKTMVSCRFSLKMILPLLKPKNLPGCVLQSSIQPPSQLLLRGFGQR